MTVPTRRHPPHLPVIEPSSAPVAMCTEQLSADTPRSTVHRVVSLVVFAGALTLIATCVVRGRDLQRDAPHVFLGAAPLVGRDPHDGWDWRFGLGLVAAIAIAVAVVVATRRMWFWTLRLRTLTAASAVSAIAFATALALTDGADGLFRGAAHETEYVAGLDSTPPAGEFVRTFTERIDGYSVHVRGHPPGFVLVLKLLASFGARGAWPAVLLAVLATGLIVAATLVTVWAVAGDSWARRAAPFLIVAPYSVWLVTSADAFFAAVGAAGTAAITISLRRCGWAATALSALGGAAIGALLFLTYLGAVFALVPAVLLVAALVRRRPGAVPALVAALVTALAVVAAFRFAGFWWFEGARRTRTEYWEGTAQFRTWRYFGLANIAVALIAVGPAVVAGLLRLRDARVWLLSGGALLALTASHLSQYTRGEVERIWLLFYPWLTLGAGAVAIHRVRRTGATWVGLQAACAITLQAALVTKW